MLVHPAIAQSCASAIDDVASHPELHDHLAGAAVGSPDLLRRFAGISDGRSDQGRDHPVAVVLTLCAAAALAGMRSFTAIAGWVADVPAELLARLYAASVPGSPLKTTPSKTTPSKTTLWRVLTGVDTSAVDAAIGSWLAERAQHAPAAAVASIVASTAARVPDTDPADGADRELLAIAVDGKTVRVRHAVACGEWIASWRLPMVT